VSVAVPSLTDAPTGPQEVATPAPVPPPADLAPAVLPRDLTPHGMFMSADIVVKGVMLGLAFASVLTWTIWPGAGTRTAAVSSSSGATPAFYKASIRSRAYDWTGIYLGIDGGYGSAPTSGTLTTSAGDALQPYRYSAKGPFAGAFLGVNYQFDRFVVGAEADWQGSNLTGDNQSLPSG
jgi:biopolymer transport protein ExbB